MQVAPSCRVSALLLTPSAPKACLVLGHGAGAGMLHPFLAETAVKLSRLGIATLRYQFPYMENHSKRPDPPSLCHATVRAAVAVAHDHLPSLPLFAAGKSFGGRMTSQAQAAAPLVRVQGIAFLGFPLHPPKQPSVARAAHLSEIEIPLLFLQGTRDAFAERSLLDPVVGKLRTEATVKWIDGADHSFHVPVRGGRTDDQVHTEMLKDLANWMELVIQQSNPV